MFEVNDVVLMDGFVFDKDALAENQNKFKIISVTKGTFTDPEAFQFGAEGSVNGVFQTFSTITLENRAAIVTKVEDTPIVDVKIIYPPGSIKAGTKVKPNGTGKNPDFIKGKTYTVEEVFREDKGLYLVTIFDDDEHLCYCLIGNVACPHAGSWQVVN